MFRFSFLILFEETFKKLPLMNKDRKCSLRLLLLHETTFRGNTAICDNLKI
jgi:hypothetical protein